jgi:hypothetical protein
MGLEAEIGSYRKPEGLRNDPEKRGASRRAQNTMDGILEAGDGLEPNDLDGRGAEGQVSLRPNVSYYNAMYYENREQLMLPFFVFWCYTICKMIKCKKPLMR